MKLLIAVNTFDRVGYLKKLIASWAKTRNRNHKWIGIISDDGSTDGTLNYLKDLEDSKVGFEVIRNDRVGIHCQVNRALRRCSELDFDLGFMVEDDVSFHKPRWDDAYLDSVHKSGIQHLVHFSPDWGAAHPEKCKFLEHPILDRPRSIQSYIDNPFYVLGAFWTFTPEIISKVGYFDLQTFGLWQNGHIDYTRRCMRLGFNGPEYVYDAIGAESYLDLKPDEYYSTMGDLARFRASRYGVNRLKILRANRDGERGYVSYNELPYGMEACGC